MDERFPYSGPTVESRNLCRDSASKKNIYLAIEASFTAGKGTYCKKPARHVIKNVLKYIFSHVTLQKRPLDILLQVL